MKILRPYEGILCLLLMFFVPVVIYQLSIRQTVNSALRYASQKKTLEREQQLPFPETSHTEKIIWNSENILEMVLHVIRQEYCVLEQYTPFITESSEELSVSTLEFLIKGEYHALLKVLDQAERQLTGCNIQSVTYRTIRTRRSNAKPELQMTLLLRHLSESQSMEVKQ